ncbi:MAG: YicC/YloC family endoribonuclease [Polyangiales bacterium]
MQSMTGYGSGRAALGDGHVVVDLRAVNHRFLDVRVRLPSRIQAYVPTVERVVRARLGRGRVDATARFEGQTLPQPTLDVDRARAVLAQLVTLRDALSPNEPLPLSLLASVPDLFTADSSVDEEASRGALEEASNQACDALLVMRGLEGEAISKDLAMRLEEVAQHVSAIETELPHVIESRRMKLRDRLDALLSSVDVELQPSRLEQEIAILADRGDVTEELVRLGSHRSQMLDLLVNSDQPVGKRIDFLLQEIGREINTLGSKVQDTTVTPLVIALKSTVEQMREQAQNVL